MKTPQCLAGRSQTKLITIQKRIGSTLYRVNIQFCETGTETMDDKILRLIKRELRSGKAAGL